MSKTSKCHVIIELHCVGVSNLIIIKQLKVPKSTVYDTVARFKELGDDKDCPRSGHPYTALTPKIIKALVRGSEGIQNDQSEKWLKR